MTKPEERCGALNADGTQCKKKAAEVTDWWRCKAHIDWHRHSTPAERQMLANLEIQALIDSVTPEEEIDYEEMMWSTP